MNQFWRFFCVFFNEQNMSALRAEDDSKASRSILSLIGMMFDFTSLIDCNACMIMFCTNN
jgi:hypothetical protein